MVEKRRRLDEIAQVAQDLGVNEGTLGNWCAVERRRHGIGDGELTVVGGQSGS